MAGLKESKVCPRVSMQVKVVSCEKPKYQQKDKETKKPMVDDKGLPIMAEAKNFDVEVEFSDGIKLKGFEFVEPARNHAGLVTLSSAFEIKPGSVGTLHLALRNGDYGLDLAIVQFIERALPEVKK